MSSELGDERGNRLVELRGGDDAPDEPDRERLLGTDTTAAHDDVLRPTHPDEPREPLGPAGAGDHPDRRLWESELHVLCRDAEVAGERELQPDTEHVTVQPRDHGLGTALGSGDVLRELRDRPRACLEEPGDVTARGERVAGSGENDEPHRRVRVELVNESTNRLLLYYQIDYTLDRGADKLDRGAAALDPHSAPEREPSYLHVAYRRENPTTQKRDFVIFEGLRGPGRFLGSVVGIRVRQDELFAWYGEGEVKMFFDGEGPLPTICGTGLEDYVGTAWAMGPHQTPHAGVPFEIRDPARPDRRMPDLTGFYRWHLADPIVFRESLRVTIQQIGAVFVLPGEEAKRAAIDAGHPVAGTGWRRSQGAFPADWAIAERSDDYCAAAFAYCRTPQAVRRYASEEATAQVERLPYEQASPAEAALDFVGAAIGQG